MKKTLRPVVVYLPAETIQKLDQLARLRSLVSPTDCSRTQIVREQIEKLIANSPPTEVAKAMANIATTI